MRPRVFFATKFLIFCSYIQTATQTGKILPENTKNIIRIHIILAAFLLSAFAYAEENTNAASSASTSSASADAAKPDMKKGKAKGLDKEAKAERKAAKKAAKAEKKKRQKGRRRRQ